MINLQTSRISVSVRLYLGDFLLFFLPRPFTMFWEKMCRIKSLWIRVSPRILSAEVNPNNNGEGQFTLCHEKFRKKWKYGRLLTHSVVYYSCMQVCTYIVWSWMQDSQTDILAGMKIWFEKINCYLVISVRRENMCLVLCSNSFWFWSLN